MEWRQRKDMPRMCRIGRKLGRSRPICGPRLASRTHAESGTPTNSPANNAARNDLMKIDLPPVETLLSMRGVQRFGQGTRDESADVEAEEEEYYDDDDGPHPRESSAKQSSLNSFSGENDGSDKENNDPNHVDKLEPKSCHSDVQGLEKQKPNLSPRDSNARLALGLEPRRFILGNLSVDSAEGGMDETQSSTTDDSTGTSETLSEVSIVTGYYISSLDYSFSDSSSVVTQHSLSNAPHLREWVHRTLLIETSDYDGDSERESRPVAVAVPGDKNPFVLDWRTKCLEAESEADIDDGDDSGEDEDDEAPIQPVIIRTRGLWK